jgi:hypothetical protein
VEFRLGAAHHNEEKAGDPFLHTQMYI